jgi:hypothetical protein
MPGKGGKGYVKDFKDMRDRIAPYLDELTAWLKRRQEQIDNLQKGKGHEGGDPPPTPPDLGP